MKPSSPTCRTILLCTQDEGDLTQDMIQVLGENGFRIDVEVELHRLCSHLQETRPDAVLLDLAGCRPNVWECLKELRPHYHGPVVLLSDLLDEAHQIVGFELGADGFLSKPVTPLLLARKVGALLRAVKRATTGDDRSVEVDGLCLHPSRREVTLEGRPIFLTAVEFDVLWHLTRNAGRVVSRGELHETLHGSKHNGVDRAIDIYISRIRRKIGDDAVAPKRLKTVRGAGYLAADHQQRA